MSWGGHSRERREGLKGREGRGERRRRRRRESFFFWFRLSLSCPELGWERFAAFGHAM